jgi:hypothetical protein
MARISDLRSQLMKHVLVGPRRAARIGDSLGKELPDRRSDRLGVRLEREVPGLEEADVGLRDVAPERLRAGRQEEGVVPAPDRQEPRPVLAEVVSTLLADDNLAGGGKAV